MYRLTYQDGESPKVHTFSSGEVVIGRSPDCQVVLKDFLNLTYLRHPIILLVSKFLLFFQIAPNPQGIANSRMHRLRANSINRKGGRIHIAPAKLDLILRSWFGIST